MLFSGACLIGCASATQKAQREVQRALTAEQYQWNGAHFSEYNHRPDAPHRTSAGTLGAPPYLMGEAQGVG